MHAPAHEFLEIFIAASLFLTLIPSCPLALFPAWRQTVSLYDVPSNTRRAVFRHEAAVLDCAFADATHGLAGGLDCRVKWYVVSLRLVLL